MINKLFAAVLRSVIGFGCVLSPASMALMVTGPDAPDFDRYPSIPSVSRQDDGLIKIQSISPLPTSVWVPVPVPYQEAQALGERAILATPDARMQAYRGRQVGYQTVFYDVYVGNLPALGRIEGDLVPPRVGDRFLLTEFSPTDWVTDDLSRLIPTYLVKADGVVYRSNATQMRLTLETPARQSWVHTTRCGPLVLHYLSTVWSAQDVIEWQLFAVHSDPMSNAFEGNIEALRVVFGEPVVVDDRLPLGIERPRYDRTRDQWFFDLISEPLIMGDAQGLPIIRGALLCTDSSKPSPASFRSTDEHVRARVDKLRARGGGAPVTGRNWDGAWLAFQSAVEPRPTDAAELESMLDQQRGFMLRPQHLFAQRARGLAKAAGTTGAQEDFGVSRGAELYLGELLFGTTWHYHTQEPMRPMHYREASGTPLRTSAHPGWVTWGQLTHWSCAVSPDRLGKPCPVPFFNTHRWSGKDDQHVSSNNLHAAVASFDWPAHRMLVDDEIRVAQANVRLLNGYGPGAPRAVGRRMLQNANQWILTGREDVWNNLVIGHGAKAHQFSFTPLSGFRTQGVPLTDLRVMVDPATREAVPAMVIWEEGLCMTGLAAGWAAHRYRQELGLPEHPATHLIGAQLVGIATTLVRHYFAIGPDGWQTWLNVRWTGAVPDPRLIAGTTNVPGQIRDRVTVASRWFDWIGPGLYYLARARHGLVLPDDVRIRLHQIFTEWETEVLPTASIERRQWFAVIDQDAR